MVAHVLVARHADHLPLHRQAGMMARQGVELDRSTLSFWMGHAAAEIAPVVARLREVLLGSARAFADETVVPMLDPGRGRTKTGCLWAVARDDRPSACGRSVCEAAGGLPPEGGGADPPAVVCSYAPGRGQEHNDRLLGAYRGIPQRDGCATCKTLADPGRGKDAVTPVFCWSHVRRGFYDLARAGAAPIAAEALARIAALRRVEAEVRGKPAAERFAVRQARSRPLVADLRAWFEAQVARLPGRGPLAGAIRYALNHWGGLERFPGDGRIELDTNSVERAMRPIKLSKKNALFAGSDEGGANWAHIASLVETCKLNGVNPQTYFADLLTRLVHGWPQARIDELMPWHWATSKPA